MRLDFDLPFCTIKRNTVLRAGCVVFRPHLKQSCKPQGQVQCTCTSILKIAMHAKCLQSIKNSSWVLSSGVKLDIVRYRAEHSKRNFFTLSSHVLSHVLY